MACTPSKNGNNTEHETDQLKCQEKIALTHPLRWLSRAYSRSFFIIQIVGKMQPPTPMGNFGFWPLHLVCVWVERKKFNKSIQLEILGIVILTNCLSISKLFEHEYLLFFFKLSGTNIGQSLHHIPFVMTTPSAHWVTIMTPHPATDGVPPHS